MTDKIKKKMNVRNAAIAGAVAAVICHFLPHEYQALCIALTKLGTVSCGGPI